MTAMKVVVCLLLLIQLTRAEQLPKVYDVNRNSGLYFEEAGKLFFYANEWKMVSNVNLTVYRTELNYIQYIVNVISANCEELKQIETGKNASIMGNEGCGPILYLLNILMADIEESDSNCFGKDARTKRHVLSELVSYGSQNNYASHFDQFRNMSARGKESITSPDKETSYIMSSMNSFRKSTDRLAINEYVANQLSVVNTTLIAARNGSVNAVRLFQLRTILQDIISYQTSILTTFASKQKQYLSFVPLIGMKNAQIPSMISSENVIKELESIRNIVVEKGLGFPMKITSEDVHFLFHISSPEIGLYRDQIFVTFKLPLISKLSGNYYSLLKVTSALNHIENNIYRYLTPNHEFIAIDAHQEKYIPLTADDLNNCHQMTTSMICKQTTPAMLTSTTSDIEINVFLKQTPQSTGQASPNQRYIRNNVPILMKVLKPNSWLVTMPHAAKVRYICEGSNVQEWFVQMNGLFTIGSNCKFSIGSVVVTGHSTFLKNSIREHQTDNFQFTWESDDFQFILKHDYLLSNNISQVIGFGESEKILRISSTNDDIKAKRDISTMKEYWQISKELAICLMVLFLAGLIALIIHACSYNLWLRQQKQKISAKNSNSSNVQLTVRTGSSTVKPTIPSKTTDQSCSKPSAPLYPSVDVAIAMK